MKSIISIMLLIGAFNYLEAQTNFNTSWICGTYGLKITFNGLNVDTFPYIMTGRFFGGGGNSNICDSNGRLILVSDGMNIYDSTLNFIENGDSLLSYTYYDHEDGWSACSQTSIFLPFDDSIYYLITPDVTDSMFNWWTTPPFPHSAPFDRLLYHKIDMKANGGAGKVLEKGVPILEHCKLSKSQMMACKHANGKDWWLVKQWSEENKIVKFLVKKDSIIGPFYQTFSGTFHAADQTGQSMFSQDGTKYATTCRGTDKIFMADFDRCTGEFTNPIWYNVPDYPRHDPSDSTLTDPITQGLAFSPNGRFLYVMKYWNILQLDLQDNDTASSWYHVAGLDTTWNQFTLYCDSYLGKDNKLYIGNFAITAKELSVIGAPDNKGILCAFCAKCLVFPPGWGWTSTPPCMPNYDLGALVTCWPLDSGTIVKENEIKIFPNPASSLITIEYMSSSKSVADVKLLNTLGQVIHEQVVIPNKKIQVDISTFSDGVYYLKCEGITKKIIKE